MGTVTLYFSDVGFTTEPGDSPANTYWDRRIHVPLSVQQSLFRGTALGGRSEISFGSIVLANQDGGLDDLSDYEWDGRLIEVLFSALAAPVLADFAVVFSATAERMVPGDEVLIEVRDLQILLEEPYQPARFLGTGGAEGPAELLDRRKPRLLGIRRQFVPVALDRANLVWCYHDGPVGGPLAVRDAGVALTFDANYASYAALIAATIPAGFYGTCNALGMIRLNAQPTGVLTMDAEGAKPGATFLSTFADLCVEAVTHSTDLLAGDFATGTVSAMNTTAPQTLGHWYDGAGEAVLRNVLDELAGSVGAFYGFNDARKIVLGRLDAPAASANHEFDERHILDLRPLPVERRLRSQIVAWGQRVRVMNDDEVAGSVTGAARTALTEEWRLETASSTSVATASLLSLEERLNSSLDSSTDAQAEAARRLALFGARRRSFEVTAEARAGLFPGQTVQLQSLRFGLDAGAKFRLLRLDRDAANEQITMEVWG